MRKLNRSLHAKLLIALLAVCVLSFGAGRAYAKYVREKQGNGLIRAQEFYFTSDYLTTSGETYILNAGTEQISFQLRNYDDQLRWSENDISYEVTASDGAKLKWTEDGTEFAKLEGSISTGDDNSVNVILTGLQAGKSYSVTAKGTAGYEATLTASFKVNQNTTGLYKHLDTTSNDAYVLLTVWSEAIAPGTVTIAYPAGLVPDNTNPDMVDAKTNDNSFAVAFESYQSRTYRFFKEGSYSGEFSVKLNETEATPATPQ